MLTESKFGLFEIEENCFLFSLLPFPIVSQRNVT